MSNNAKAITDGFRKYPILIISGVISVILLVAIYCRSDLLTAQRAELDKYTAESNGYRSNIVNSAQLREQLDFLIEANKAIKDRALVAGGLAQNLQYFYRLESEVGIKYIDLRPGSKTPVAGQSAIYAPLNYLVIVQGDFTQIITFLKRLEQGAYFCRINTAVASASGSNVTLNLNLDFLGMP